VADDLEQTHNVAAMRIKHAVMRRSAKLVVVGAVRGELDDFATVSIRCAPGHEAEAVEAIAARLLAARPVEGAPAMRDGAQGVDHAHLDTAAALLATGEGFQPFFLYAMRHHGAEAAGAAVTALANLAVLAAGPDEAGRRLVVMPHEANTWGLRDAGVKPGAGGWSFAGMIEAARAGTLKALVVAGDNPLHFAADKTGVREALERLEYLLVIDSVLTDTAQFAHAFLPVGHQDSHEGTTVSGDRLLLRVRPAIVPLGEQHRSYETLATLAAALGVPVPATAAAAAGTAIAKQPGYKEAAFDLLGGSVRLQVPATTGRLQAVPSLGSPAGDGLRPLVLRTLYTSYEAAAARSLEADRLHREDGVMVGTAAAGRLGIREGETVRLRSGAAELDVQMSIGDNVPDGVVVIPLHLQAGLGAAFGESASVEALVATPV
jgi:predicted molibdopterin-dependent oxidoreductase YjgC